MTLEMIETLLRWSGGLMAWATLGVVLYGIWRGTRHQAGRTSGRAAGWLRSSLFYLLAMALFLAFSTLFWKPLPSTFSPATRALALAAGTLTYFPGLAFLLWGRLVLGRMYFVSTSFGAQLYADHQLVTRGPFAIVRHPMYLGLIVAAIGSLWLYQTWTTVAFTVFAPFILFRACSARADVSSTLEKEARE
ncbi:MAG: isoprenylcysteine carboxylmethyltransferase family protein [Anaerolineales bacterium]|nr:isoprenylcysteine carboxylmethyltransferase family protein [Anaerolineales bacterium]